MKVSLVIVFVCLALNMYAQDSSSVKISSLSFGFRPNFSPRYKGSEFIHFTKSKGVIDVDILLLPKGSFVESHYGTSLPIYLGVGLAKMNGKTQSEHLMGISYSRKFNTQFYDINDSTGLEFAYRRHYLVLSDYYKISFGKKRWRFYSGIKFDIGFSFKPRVYLSSNVSNAFNDGNYVEYPSKSSFLINLSIPYGVEYRVLKRLSIFIERTIFYATAENIYGRKTSIYADYIDPPLPFLSMDLDNGLGMGLSYRF